MESNNNMENGKSHKGSCFCGTVQFTVSGDPAGMGLVDVYAAVIDDFPFSPGIHVNYQEKKVRMKDGLPKMKDMPKEMGGSGVALVD